VALEPLGKQCVVACADPVPANYTFLPGRETVVTELPDDNFDLVIALDAGEFSRYGALYTRHRAFFDAATTLNLDHHVTSKGIGACAIIDVASAATAELLTLFLLHRGVSIGPAAAQCLLAGIITDTRSFEFDATTDRTLLAGAYLVASGAVPESIIKPMYRMKPLAKGRLWGRALASLASAADGRIVWATIRLADVIAAEATADMDDGLPSYLVDTEGVAFAALFREADGATRVSVRSVAPHDAAAVCAQFGGGGHVRAAGCTLRMPIAEAQRTFIPALEAALGQ
jgi:phosphoesterase RecJ-like protein